MRAFQVIEFVDAAPVRKVDLISDDPQTLRLTGTHFLMAKHVRIDGLDANFTIQSDMVIDAVVPESLENTPIRDVTVLADTVLGRSSSALAEYRVSKNCITGMTKLVQRYLKVLLTTPGTDAFHSAAGGGLLQVIGSTFDPENPTPIIGHLVTSAQRAAEQIIASQVGRRLPDSERLLSAQVMDVGFSTRRLQFQVQVILTAAGGAQSVTKFGMTPSSS